MPFVVSLANDISVIEETLLSNLSVLLREGFKSRDVSLVASCLYSYQAVGKIEAAEKIFRAVIVDPSLDTLLEKQ